MLSVRLSCPSCQWWTLAGEEETLRRLRSLGLLRRAKLPPEDLTREMLRIHGHRLRCDRCGQANLKIELDGHGGDDGEWEQVVVCEICREPIPPERLAAVPDTKRCTRCQSATDQGATFAEPEFCPRCGAPLELRLSRSSGIARYKLFCTGNPPCRL